MFMYHQWVSLPISIRHQLAHKFGIPKKGPTEVFNNEIKSDGYSLKDIEQALTIPNIQEFVESDETNHEVLWGYMLEKIMNPAFKAPEPMFEPVPAPNYTTTPDISYDVVLPIKKIGRPKKVK